SGLASVNEGIARHLRHQRPDEIEQLFVYAQLLIAVGGGEGRYGTTLTPPKHWARWREEEFTDTQLSAWANRPLPAAGPQSLPPPSRRRRTKPKDQDRLLAALLQPER